ncbi:hypothetical protein [Pseudobacter ginsenosidimutans]|nr:hypothetical protein [Pseudobacter ginsenosidimutans]QEC44805.1 hypothetical protein FSB84_25140 [Pseudobacter ginsenosidimutans]
MLFILAVILFVACQGRGKPASQAVAYDTTTLPETFTDQAVPDSMILNRFMDSFFSIKPVAAFAGNQLATPFQKMAAAFIDTSGMERIPLHFTDTLIYKYNKDREPVLSREISRSKRFTVEVQSLPDSRLDGERKIFVNGRQLRAGIGLDTSLAGFFYYYNFELNSEESCLLRFGKKEYLYLKGFSHNCTGTACSVSFHILYDLATHKGLINEQYRMELPIGYDRQNNCPVFLESKQEDMFYDAWESILYSGKLYKWTPEKGARPALNRKGDTIQFEGYERTGRDSLLLIKAVFPDH